MKAIYASPNTSTAPVRLARMPITSVMSKAETVSARALLEEALVHMAHSGVRYIAVVDEQGRCLGVLSDRVVTAAWAIDYDALSHRTVAGVLDLEPAVISARDAVVDAARLMHAKGVDAVAVLDDHGRPVGMVSGGDLINLLAR